MIGTRQSKLNVKRLISIFAVCAILGFSVLLLLSNFANWQAIIEPISKLSLVITVLSLAWLYLNKWGWRHCRFLGNILKKWPDVNGRWVGEIDREGSDPKHKFVLEIVQTLSYIRCSTYTANGDSHSFAADITVSEDSSQYYIVFHWLGQTSGLQNNQLSGNFHGTTVLRLCNNEKSLEGHYFTDRRPNQSRGRLSLKRTEERVIGRFND